MIRRLAFLAAPMLLCAVSAHAAPNAQAQREIGALIDALGASGCRFERNGSWYDADRAKAHLRKKNEYLQKRGLADTAELFIERAASESSLSGKPYRVRCPGDQIEPARSWFERRLRAIRGGG